MMADMQGEGFADGERLMIDRVLAAESGQDDFGVGERGAGAAGR
jgi:hypothetical protein